MVWKYEDAEGILNRWNKCSCVPYTCSLKLSHFIPTPKASLLQQVEALPVVWEAKMHCVKFWLKVLNNEMYKGRLLRKIVRQAVECGKGVWVKNMAKCVGVFEWQGIGGDTINSLTDAEIGDMLSSVA